jgi:hypothetical protein
MLLLQAGDHDAASGGQLFSLDVIFPESFLPADIVPQRGIKYFDSYDWEFTLSTKEKVRNLLGKLLQRQ